VVAIKIIIFYKQIGDLRALNQLLQKPLFVILYIINIFLFIAIAVEGFVDKKCDADAELLLIFVFATFTLV